MKPEGLLAIDPGVHVFGWAFFHKELTACGLTTIAEPSWPWSMWLLERLVVEVPQVYSQRHWKGDPNDLVDVALAAGIVIGRTHAGAVLTTRPHEWKGNVPKAVHQLRVLALLDTSERDILDGCGVVRSKLHNVVDAVGLGLWALGRTAR